MNPSLMRSVRAYLLARPGNAADLVGKLPDRFEIQVNVHPADGERIDDHKWKNINYTWSHRRYPRHAGTVPQWDDEQVLQWALEDFADLIGITGLSPVGSYAVGFDFDGPGHDNRSHTEEQILALARAAGQLPICDVRHSRNSGLHVWIWLDGFGSTNHTEHATLATCIWETYLQPALIEQLDFPPVVDKMGGNMWIWSRQPKPHSFQLIHAASQILRPSDLPVDWQSYSPKAVRSLVHKDVDEDDEHKRLFNEMQLLGAPVIWQSDQQCYHIHSHALSQIAHKGIYRTKSEGTDYSSPNAFAFLRPNGALYVVRFGNADEDPMWGRTTNGWPAILYNVDPTAASVAAETGATLINGGFCCGSFPQAARAARQFGIELPPFPEGRPFSPIVFIIRRESITIQTDRHGKSDSPEGWGAVSRTRLQIVKVREVVIHDEELVRHLVITGKRGPSSVGWQYKDHSGDYVDSSKENCRDILTLHHGQKMANDTLATALQHYWLIVSEPLKTVTGRKINVGAQFVAEPVYGPHPHWDMVFEHTGRGLTRYILQSPDCRKMGIKTGADYLWMRLAIKCQLPKHPLPVLCLYSRANNTGKSAAAYRAPALLFSSGAVDIRRSLQGTFNGTLEGALWGYIAEHPLGKREYTLLKELVEEEEIWIRKMNTNEYPTPNYMALSQSGNSLDNFYFEQGDERFVLWHVPKIRGPIIPWHMELRPAMVRELPHVMHTLLSMELPPACDRLYLPPVDTAWKRHKLGLCSYPIADQISEWLAGRWSGTLSELFATLAPEVPLNMLWETLEQGQLDEFGIRLGRKRVNGNDIITLEYE